MLEDRGYMRSSGYRSFWSMTAILLVVNALIFVALSLASVHLQWSVLEYFALSVRGLRGGYLWQLITFQFLHAGLGHLLGNSIGLFFFGRAMEEYLGRKRFLTLYLMSGAIGGLLQMSLGFWMPAYFGGPVLGASAGVFGLIAAFATRAPDQPITTLLFLIIPVTFPARVLLWIEAAIAIYGILVPFGGLAHAAHLGGMLTGIAYIRWFFNPWPSESSAWRPFKRRPRSRSLVSVKTGGSTWRKASGSDSLPSEEFISREVDPILDKISAEGIHSLTEREREILDAARKKMGRRS